ncbi:dynamin family protein [Sporosarcina trichiuri]|uniref:dynamin family protein n=1 Tax=Sporosarcina trichiuri TaxID=3056445 RepID=UPI0025B3C08D|nr:dynamin family protein [Sporosarcina sp. 0.2-SM1T-5]WJY26435.1 dynamin family protein [Sporosarcina sp. 0.2-SM1T-5]
MTATIERSPILKTYDTISRLLPESTALPLLRDLQQDMDQDYYTIVTVGEFKHGKSTMVNALLGGEWMPADVTPTTALIHAVFYGDTPEMHIIRKGKEPEIRPLEALSEYSAGQPGEREPIEYIKLFVPSPLLKERVVLVDTPGLNDLNEQRSAVTETFIPRADAVLFTLDMRAPVSETEYEFLQSMQEKQGIETVLFPMNFMDMLEEEEMEDTAHYIERRLSGLKNNSMVTVVPISAKLGLAARTQQDEELLAYSNIPVLEEKVKTLLTEGNRRRVKQERNSYRLSVLRDIAIREAEERLAILEADEDVLKQEMDRISGWLASQDDWKAELDEYISERRQEIESIAVKSLYYFSGKLKKQVANRIDVFKGTDIDHFINTELPVFIHTGFDNWIDQYAVHFRELFKKLEMELAKGLSQAFDETVSIQSRSYREMGSPEKRAAAEMHYGNATIKAGLVAGGVSVAALLTGATVILPVMGMVALPLIQSKIQATKLANAKPELKNVMDMTVSDVAAELENAIREYIGENVTNIRIAVQTEFEKKLNERAGLVDEQLTGKAEKQEQNAVQKTAMKELIELLKGDQQ